MAKVAACMICKDSASTIERAVASIRPFVDEINIYDTGSTDDTVAIIEKLNRDPALLVCNACGRLAERTGPVIRRMCSCENGDLVEVPIAPIRVERGEWRDDFAWARQQSWEMASEECDWLIWLDDDDEIAGAEQIRHLIAAAPAELDGFVLQYEYAHDESGNCVCVLWRERLIRRSAGYRWQGAVHEVLAPPEGHQHGFATVPAQHIRYLHRRPADRYTPDRNLRILERIAAEAEERGDQPDPRTLAYLATENMAHGQFVRALPFLQQYLDHPDAAWGDERSQVHHKLALCLRAVGNLQAAVGAELQATAERDDWAENMVGLAQCFAVLGRWDRAERWARRALEQGMPESPLILNPLEFTLVPLTIVADSCLNQGRSEEALTAIRQALQAAPANQWVAQRAAEIERLAGENELVGAIMLLREILVRHDENLKAWNLLSGCVPYVVAERAEIVKARADQREMVAHYLRPDEYRRWYTDEPKESTLTDDHIDLVGESFGRVSGLLDGLREQEAELGRKPVLLDLGCNDWWMGEFFARQGFRCDGVELNLRSYELALERIERFGRDATVVHGDLHDAAKLLAAAAGNVQITDERGDIEWRYDPPLYDAVSLFEVFEHVPDPEHTLEVMESLLAPGGRIYISTPNGAFERGQMPQWARVARKSHLRAIPLSELAETLSPRGEITALAETAGDRVGFAAYKPAPRKGKIVFYAGPGWEPWSPASINTTGLGGSETALVQVSARLARGGWDVRVYSGAEPGLYVGSLWRPFTAFDPGEPCDLLVSSRIPAIFDEPLAAKRTALWCHDHSYPGQLTEERAAKIDEIVVLSDWQRARFARLYPFAAGKLTVIRNGVTLHGIGDPEDDRYPDRDRPFAERKPRAIYSSSADRGLDVLLELWPRIREQVPDAELHVFYGFDILDRIAIANPSLLAYKQHVLALAEQCGGEDGGVFLRGRVGQRDLNEEMQQASVWAYPTAFLETSCIGAMEARAAGLPIVTSDLAALRETAGKNGLLLAWGKDEDESGNRDDSYQKRFVEEVVAQLTDPQAWATMHGRSLKGRESLDWGQRIPQWELLALEAADPVATRVTVAAAAAA